MRDKTIKLNNEELDSIIKARRMLAKYGYHLFSEIPPDVEEGNFTLGAIASFASNELIKKLNSIVNPEEIKEGG